MRASCTISRDTSTARLELPTGDGVARRDLDEEFASWRRHARCNLSVAATRTRTKGNTMQDFSTIDINTLDSVCGGQDTPYGRAGSLIGGTIGAAGGTVGGSALGGLVTTPTVAGVPAGVLAGGGAGAYLGAEAGQAVGRAAGNGLWNAGSWLGEQAGRTGAGQWVGRQLNNVFGRP
jgi:hypothetical protein